MTNAIARTDAEIAEFYQAGCDDLNGPCDNRLARMLTGYDRRLAKPGVIPWVLLPACIVQYRRASETPPPFGALEVHERQALQYIAAVLEFGRDGAWLSDAVGANGHDPLYFDTALTLEGALEKALFFRDKKGGFVVKGPKVLNKYDALDAAVSILEDCQSTGVAPIVQSYDDRRKVPALTEVINDAGEVSLEAPVVADPNWRSHVWIADIKATAFDKIGLRHKHSGEVWEEPYVNFMPPKLPDGAHSAARRYSQGELLQREDFPEASAVYNRKLWARQNTLSIASFCYVVDERVADLLAEFDLGSGGMFPYPIYQDDMVTPIGEQWHVLDLGSRQSAFLAGASDRSSLGYLFNKKRAGIRGNQPEDDVNDGVFMTMYPPEHEAIVATPEVLLAPDLWVDTHLHGVFWMSSALAEVLQKSGFERFMDFRTVSVIRN